MSTRSQVIFWSIIALLIIVSVPIVSNLLFPKDQCAVAFQHGKGLCCYGKGPCRHCFDVAKKEVRVGNSTVAVDPFMEQHNTLVDTIMCECEHNSTNSDEIERLYRILTGQEVSSDVICSSGLATLVKYNSSTP